MPRRAPPPAPHLIRWPRRTRGVPRWAEGSRGTTSPWLTRAGRSSILHPASANGAATRPMRGRGHRERGRSTAHGERITVLGGAATDLAGNHGKASSPLRTSEPTEDALSHGSEAGLVRRDLELNQGHQSQMCSVPFRVRVRLERAFRFVVAEQRPHPSTSRHVLVGDLTEEVSVSQAADRRLRTGEQPLSGRALGRNRRRPTHSCILAGTKRPARGCPRSSPAYESSRTPNPNSAGKPGLLRSLDRMRRYRPRRAHGGSRRWPLTRLLATPVGDDASCRPGAVRPRHPPAARTDGSVRAPSGQRYSSITGASLAER
jgi:hypothetical protein